MSANIALRRSMSSSMKAAHVSNSSWYLDSR